MNAVVAQALEQWHLKGATYHLVAARENAVFKVTHGLQTFALRLHRKGYRTDAELWSELQWMAAMGAAGISVPAPVKSITGQVLHVLDGTQVDVLAWLTGTTLDAAPTGRADVFRQLGTKMAHLHDASDAWSKPDGFTRCRWDRDGLVGPDPLWGRFWENPSLSPEDEILFCKFRDTANVALHKLEKHIDTGLIHADLVPANVMVDGSTLHLIDFDDGGFGFRLFDIATALLKHMDAPDYPAIHDALIGGYTSARNIDLSALDLFMTLRAATYVGWNTSRMNEDGAVARNQRFINKAKTLVHAYLAD